MSFERNISLTKDSVSNENQYSQFLSSALLQQTEPLDSFSSPLSASMDRQPRSTGVIKKFRRKLPSFSSKTPLCNNQVSSSQRRSECMRKLSFESPHLPIKKKRIEGLRGDRFIPERLLESDMDCIKLIDLYNVNKFTDPQNGENVPEITSQTNSEDIFTMKLYHDNLDKRLFDGCLKQTKILTIQQHVPSPSIANYKGNANNAILKLNNNNEEWQTNIRKLYNYNKNNIPSSLRGNRNSRDIPSHPERILDAPGLVDDFYLNLLDWSCNNILAVALADSVYLWNAETGDIERLLTCSEQSNIQNLITSLSWIDDGSYLAVGTNDNDVQLWDVVKHKKVRTLRGHISRVGALSWNSHILSSGSRSGKIINHDVRVLNHHINTLAGHSQEVCGLKWSPDGSQLASGGNDNILNIWDLNQHVTRNAGLNTQTEPRYSFPDHKAAVKALAWCPWSSSLLASGGGTQDRQLKFWNTQTGNLIQSIDTKSQVCSVIWSKYQKELVSSHGFSQNQLIVWKYPKLKKIAELTGHTSRVLQTAQSPDGTTIVSGAGDETLRFWKIFSAPEDASKDIADCNSMLSLNRMNIR
jgi:cell division cycle protein 20 (cofactor of APC complex)